MQLEDAARAILYGTDWGDKLVAPRELVDTPSRPGLVDIPTFPGRPSVLSCVGKARFPDLSRLGDSSARGAVLHFFANHELLAMELMALMLLKFPEAPKLFRAGIARTITEEQQHLSLYVSRMEELGVELGSFPVSGYFWNVMKEITSPLQFVVQMSLTLEQANLDYSLFYQRAVADVGDTATASILRRVYVDEIRHVRHGLDWFNRWRPRLDENEDDWDAYRRLLPPPMTPRRARGPVFCAASRRDAGFSERFIHELEVYGGSRGRPPVFWVYNPLCESEIAQNRATVTANKLVSQLMLDLEHLPMFVAREGDIVLVAEPPQAEWLKHLQSLGLTAPEFRRVTKVGTSPREEKIAGLEPWGWSPGPFARFKGWGRRLIDDDATNGNWARQLLDHASFSDTKLRPLFSKAWSTAFLRSWLEKNEEARSTFGPIENVGRSYRDWPAVSEEARRLLALQIPLILKAPWGTSGRQNRRLMNETELDSDIGKWMRKILDIQGEIVLEPWLARQADISMQIDVGQKNTRVLGVRHFVTGPRLEYRGTFLDHRLGTLSPRLRRFLHADGKPLEQWKSLVLELAEVLRQHGFRGAAGIDAIIFQDASSGEYGQLFLKPLVELNPRWTMGRIALELEQHVSPGTPAAWVFLPLRECPRHGLPRDGESVARILSARYPPRMERARGDLCVSEGIVFTNDPVRARAVLTALVVGERALGEPALRLPSST